MVSGLDCNNTPMSETYLLQAIPSGELGCYNSPMCYQSTASQLVEVPDSYKSPICDTSLRQTILLEEPDCYDTICDISQAIL